MTASAALQGPACGARRAAVRPAGPLRQTLRLTRTELTLFHRYRMALYIAVFPLVFVVIGLAQEGRDALPGVDAGALSVSGTIVLAPMVVGIMHVSNVLTARREQMVLKRFRASGVAPAAIFGSTALSVLAVVAILAVVISAVLGWRFQVLPAHPVLLALTTVLTAVVLSLLGAAVTRLARNAEMAQIMAMGPFLLLYATSGLMIPLDMAPEPLAHLCRALPMAPAAELAQSAYFGRDLIGGTEGATVATGAELWTAATVPLLTLGAWTAISVLSLRFFRWDPRQAT